MGKIKLGIHPRFAAVTAVGNGLPGGNVFVDAGQSIAWENQTKSQLSREFLVTFFDISTGVQQPIWPFPAGGVAPANQCVDATGKQWLRVGSSGVVTSLDSSLAILALKYDAHVAAVGTSASCVTDTTIDPLDPMIVIRPRTPMAANLVFGVTCAVLGAIAGALATALLM